MEQLDQEIGEFVHRVKNALGKLPVKSEGSKMKIIAELLEYDFKKVRQKGYGHKEITDYLKSEDLAMPGYLVKKYMAKPTAQTDKKNGAPTDNGLDNKVGDALAKEGTQMAPEQLEQQPITSNKVDNPPDKALDNPVSKTQENQMPEPLVKKGKFVIMPDTPDGEL